MDYTWWAAVYARLGAPFPLASLLVVSIGGAVVAGTLWWIIGEDYLRQRTALQLSAAQRQEELDRLKPNLQVLEPSRDTRPTIWGRAWESAQRRQADEHPGREGPTRGAAVRRS